ncbi:hypothetical protein KR51_00005100, partial [Rubidibacter lacunae KORDI 51-2]
SIVFASVAVLWGVKRGVTGTRSSSPPQLDKGDRFSARFGTLGETA